MAGKPETRELAREAIGSARLTAFGVSNVAPAGAVAGGLVIVVAYAGFAAPLVVLILGTLQVIAAVAVLAGSQAARWFAVVVIGLNAIGQMLFIPAYPFWSLLIIAVDVVALWGLCAYGSRENLEAAA
jgi:hypothetical protein